MFLQESLAWLPFIPGSFSLTTEVPVPDSQLRAQCLVRGSFWGDDGWQSREIEMG